MSTVQTIRSIVTLYAPAVFISIFFTRLVISILPYIYDTSTLNIIKNDPWHHYQIGLLLIIISLIPYLKKRFISLPAIGIGMMIEEWPMIFADMGFNTEPIYLTHYDFIFIPALIGLFYLIQSVFTKFFKPTTAKHEKSTT